MKHRTRTLLYLGCVMTLVMVALAILSLRSLSAPEASGRVRTPPGPGFAEWRARLAPANAQSVLANYARLPLRFEAAPVSPAKRGKVHRRAGTSQSGEPMEFLARGAGYTLLLAPTEAVLALEKGREPKKGAESGKRALSFWPAVSAQPAAVREPDAPASAGGAETVLVRMKLVGANVAARMRGEDVLPGVVNYYLGNDPKKWRTNVRSYAKVRYGDVYPGIDLVFYGSTPLITGGSSSLTTGGRQGQLEYDFVVAPGADASAIKLRFEGAEKMELDARGDLEVHAAGESIKLRRPVVYQQVNSARQEVRGEYVLQDVREVTFQVAAYDAREPLVIDPVLVYSTYLGGSSEDQTHGIAVDAKGNMYVIGTITRSIDFPTENPFQPEHHGGPNFYDTFVTKFDAGGQTLIYSTYLGGRGDDIGFGIAVDAEGNAYVTGWTGSPDFPTVEPFQLTLRGSTNAFVTKFDPSGSVVYSTYLGGSRFDAAGGIAVDAEGNIYVTGSTESPDFPTANAFQPALRGPSDAFVTKFDPSGSTLVYSTYLGGDSGDYGLGIAVDSDANVYVTGQTDSLNFPTANAFQSAFGGGRSDAFVTKFDPSGQSLVYSTYLGGSDEDDGVGLAVDADGNAYVAGDTFSRDFPTVKPFQPGLAGTVNAFVTKFDPIGSPIYSTYLGGSDADFGHGIAADSSGNAYVTGETHSPDFPVKNAIQPVFGGVADAFVTEFTPDGSALVYSTYLGGNSSNWGYGVAADAAGNTYVTGATRSTDFPLRDPFQDSYAGAIDAFVTKISPDSGSRARQR